MAASTQYDEDGDGDGDGDGDELVEHTAYFLLNNTDTPRSHLPNYVP